MSKKALKNTKVNAVKVIKPEADGHGAEKYILRLFVAGTMANSSRAIVNIKAICEQYLKDNYELEIIDIYQQPTLALKEQIIAIPVLIKKFPLPEQRVIGDMSDTEKVLKGLHLLNNTVI